VRTLIDIPEAQMAALAAYCRQERISRAEAIRRAVSRFLPVAASGTKGLRDHPAFGSWKRRQVDALKYQRRLRDGWGR
jgi:hypothetical protein